MSINACDTKATEFTFSQHKNFIMVFLFLFIVIFSNFLTIPVVRENNKVRLALAIPTGALTILVNKIIDTSPLVAPKRIKAWSI